MDKTDERPGGGAVLPSAASVRAFDLRMAKTRLQGLLRDLRRPLRFDRHGLHAPGGRRADPSCRPESPIISNTSCSRSEDGDAFSRYAKTGASANAYTSFDRTAYLFSCTDRFEESLEILLDFVQSPYFTEETVKKEPGDHRAGDPDVRGQS